MIKHKHNKITYLQKEFNVLRKELSKRYKTSFSICVYENRISINGKLKDLKDKINIIAKDIVEFAKYKLGETYNLPMLIPVVAYFSTAELYEPLCLYSLSCKQKVCQKI